MRCHLVTQQLWRIMTATIFTKLVNRYNGTCKNTAAAWPAQPGLAKAVQQSFRQTVCTWSVLLTFGITARVYEPHVGTVHWQRVWDSDQILRYNDNIGIVYWSVGRGVVTGWLARTLTGELQQFHAALTCQPIEIAKRRSRAKPPPCLGIARSGATEIRIYWLYLTMFCTGWKSVVFMEKRTILSDPGRAPSVLWKNVGFSPKRGYLRDALLVQLVNWKVPTGPSPWSSLLTCALRVDC